MLCEQENKNHINKQVTTPFVYNIMSPTANNNKDNNINDDFDKDRLYVTKDGVAVLHKHKKKLEKLQDSILQTIN